MAAKETTFTDSYVKVNIEN